MTRTTELLKEIEEQTEILTNCSEGDEEYLKVSLENNIKLNKIKSELRGRLNALKEEVEFLEICSKNLNTIDYEENDRTALAVCRDINYRLASIQEEIKLIEGTI